MSRPKAYIINDNRPVRIFEASEDFDGQDVRRLVVSVAFIKVDGKISLEKVSVSEYAGEPVLLSTVSVRDQLQILAHWASIAAVHYRFYRQEMDEWVDD